METKQVKSKQIEIKPNSNNNKTVFITKCKYCNQKRKFISIMVIKRDFCCEKCMLSNGEKHSNSCNLINSIQQKIKSKQNEK